ncbi:MAG: glycosyl transferase [Chloroflexi bacterium RBG_16_48_8]|nr:MAG: glycosyl transferase [Chloroflexi bacterium RBG_16_48_8]
MQTLIIVIPTYNEAENLVELVSQLCALPLPQVKIFIVDDASPDGTGQIAERLSQERPDHLSVLHRQGKLGLGSAYITGFKAALEEEPDAIAQMDADFSHSPAYIPDFLAKLAEADGVLGSRYVPGGRLDERWGKGRLFLSWFGNFYARTILGLDLRDVTGGFRMWRRETLQGMPLDDVRSDGYVFQVEMAYIATRLGYRLIESPIYFEDRRIGQSKMSLRIQIEAALRVWQIKFLHRRLNPSEVQKSFE